ncbi:hypothetical protein E8E13_011474 [Curvularia kusanoi]|uniref:Uncharacterized protein n=1 Tax=Curvularia kusanoi TaxID=90978 RepID=A0A9P4TKP3_CURKU|nr:hypothetical protein E8E13_011474 [Curvularia kusanoi]
MPSVVYRLSKLQLSTFKASYSPLYTTTLTPNYIAANTQHPLSALQRRRQQERKKEGLWWNATNGLEISRSGCVRTWARRRMRQAFLEELKAKGYDETGKLVRVAPMQDRPEIMNVLRRGHSIDLKGTLRLHGSEALIPAKFEAVKKEMREIIEALLQGSVDIALGFMDEGKTTSRLKKNSGLVKNDLYAAQGHFAPLPPPTQQELQRSPTQQELRRLKQQQRSLTKDSRISQQSAHAGMRSQPRPRRRQERTPAVGEEPDVVKPVPRDPNAPPVKAVFFSRTESKEAESAAMTTTLEGLLGHPQPSFISRRRSPPQAGETKHEETQHGIDKDEPASSMPRVKPQAVPSEAVPRIKRVSFTDRARTRRVAFPDPTPAIQRRASFYLKEAKIIKLRW